MRKSILLHAITNLLQVILHWWEPEKKSTSNDRLCPSLVSSSNDARKGWKKPTQESEIGGISRNESWLCPARRTTSDTVELKTGKTSFRSHYVVHTFFRRDDIAVHITWTRYWVLPYRIDWLNQHYRSSSICMLMSRSTPAMMSHRKISNLIKTSLNQMKTTGINMRSKCNSG